MKAIFKTWRWGLPIILATAIGTAVRGQNPCIEGGPYTNDLSCEQQGTLSAGYGISPSSITVGAGQPIPQPTIFGLSITNGFESYVLDYDCSPQRGPFTSPINYSFDTFFDPNIPQAIWSPGTYYYTGEVVATASPCGSWPTNAGIVTINVATNAPDVMIDVDFGGGTVSSETGSAAMGIPSSDFWNYCNNTVGNPSGSMPNLLTAEGMVSPVGMLVTNLVYPGNTESPDPMYNDFLEGYFGSNSDTATLVFTNLPAGSWDVYLYSLQATFDVSVGSLNYGIETCANTTGIYWELGQQYVLYTNIIVTNGLPLTITVGPWQGVADPGISGLQLVSADHYFPPFIITQPTNVIMGYWGGTAMFNVVATGTGPLSYQWFRDGAPLVNGGQVSGANSSTLTLTNVMPWDAATYSVEIKNIEGSVVSSGAALRIWIPSSVVGWGSQLYGDTNVPSGLTNIVAVSCGQYFTLALAENGTVVAWGNNTEGQTNVPAGLTNVVAIAAGGQHSLALLGNGTVVAWGENNFGQTNVPAGLSNVVAISAGAYFSLALQNDGTITAWGDGRYGQTNVLTGFTNVLNIAGGAWDTTALAANGAVATWGDNSYGETNLSANLTNVVAVAAGPSALHSLALNGNGTVDVWGYNDYGDLNIPANVSNVVSLAAGGDYFEFSLALLDNGTVVGWGASNWGQTNIPAGLTNVTGIAAGPGLCMAMVNNEPPVIITQPANQTVVQGDNVTFTVTAAGAPQLYYQWQFNGTNLIGATGASLTVNNVQTNNIGNYSVIVTNYFGAVTSSPAVIVPSSISSQPISQTLIQGSNVTFSVSVTGTLPVTYQWYFDGTTLIPGATGSSLTISDVQYANIGDYSVVMTNALGSMVSSNALLNVLMTWFTQQPQGVITSLWSGAKFSVTIGGATPLSYQWQVNGLNLNNGESVSGANSSTLTLTGLSLQNSGLYAIVVTNSYGQVLRSTYAPLRVWSPGTAVAWTDPYDLGTPSGYYVPSSLTQAVQIVSSADGGFAAALSSNEMVVTWGGFTPPLNISNVVSIAAGYNELLVLYENGTVGAWMDAQGGQPDPYFPTNGLTNVVAIASGWGINVALRSDGTVVPWGSYTLFEPWSQIAALTNVTGIAAGDGVGNVYAICSNGRTVNWDGRGDFGYIQYTNLVSVVSGINSYFGVSSNGTVVGWGDNSYGELNIPQALLGNPLMLSAGIQGDVGLTVNDRLLVWGNLTPPPVTYSNVVAVDSGSSGLSDTGLYGLAITNQSSILPAILTATGVATNELNLQWTPMVSNVSGYALDRKTGMNGTYQEITTLSASATNYLDASVNDTNQYFYRLWVQMSGGKAGYSPEVSPPVPVLTLLSTNQYLASDSQVVLKIQTSDEDYSLNYAAVVYNENTNINYAIAVGSSDLFTNDWVPSSSGINQGQYSLTVVALDSAGNSWFSPPLPVTIYQDSSGTGTPDFIWVWQGNDPLNPWIPPSGDNNQTPPAINLTVPANATLLPP